MYSKAHEDLLFSSMVVYSMPHIRLVSICFAGKICAIQINNVVTGVVLFYGLSVNIGLHQVEKCHRASSKCADSHHPVHAQGLIQALALHSYIL